MAEITAEQTKPAKPKTNPVAAMTVVLVVAIGAAGWFWYRSNAAQSAAAATAAPQSVLHLESFVVNLNGAGENGYLRIGIDLGLDIELKEGPQRSAYLGRLRDTILSVLAAQTVEGLLSAAGKDKLKQDLLQAITTRVPEVRCREVYFTEFLVQHG